MRLWPCRPDATDPTGGARPDPTPLPLPPGAHPARLTIVPMLTELVVELVAAGEGVGVLPSWVVGPYAARGEVATVRIGHRGDIRPWYAGVRSDEDRPHVLDFVTLLRAHLAETHGLPQSV